MSIKATDYDRIIICALEDIEPVQTAHKGHSQRSIEGLQATATRNQTEPQKAVSFLVKMTGNQHAIKRNEQRNGGR